MATARNSAFNSTSTQTHGTDEELAGQISINLAGLKKTHYGHIACTIDDVLDDIASRPLTDHYSEETRREEYQVLLQTTDTLKSRVTDDAELMKIGSHILHHDTGRRSRAWKKLGNALLGVAGAVLFVAGTLALCSGMGALPGSFLASAGAWLLGIVSLAKGTAAAIGVSATVAAVGGVGGVCALYNVFGLYRPSPRQRLYNETTELTHGPGR